MDSLDRGPGRAFQSIPSGTKKHSLAKRSSGFRAGLRVLVTALIFRELDSATKSDMGPHLHALSVLERAADSAAVIDAESQFPALSSALKSAPVFSPQTRGFLRTFRLPRFYSVEYTQITLMVKVSSWVNAMRRAQSSSGETAPVTYRGD